MRFELKLAARYLRARKSSLARFTAIAAIVGIAVGVASLIVADALARGFAGEIREKLLSSSPHIQITTETGDPIPDPDAVAARFATMPDVVSVSPGALEHAVVSSDLATNYALLRADSPDAVRVGRQLAERLHVKAGDKIEIVTLANQKPVRITIDSILVTGINDYDATWIGLPPAKFAGVVGEEKFTPRTLDVTVRNVFDASDAARRISAELGPGFRVTDWQVQNQTLFAAMSLERRVVSIIVGLIILVAGLNIATTLALLVNERRFDIGVLRACGASAKSIRIVFLLEALYLGAIGAIAGVVLGAAACLATDRFGLVSLPDEVYSISAIPIRISILSVAMIVAGAMTIAFVAGLFPAHLATRVRPVENLVTR